MAERIKLTARRVEALPVKAARYTAWDADIRGFGVRVTPAGVRTYVLSFRPKGAGRAAAAKLVTIGQHGNITADKAREIAGELRGRIAKGEDPSRDTEWRSNGITVAELCDIYLADMERRGVTAKGYEDNEQVVRLYIKPVIGKLRVPDVRASDVRLLIERVPAIAEANVTKKGQVRAGVSGERTKGRVVRTLRAMLKAATRDGPPWNNARPYGPDPTEEYKVKTWRTRKRVPSPEEIAAILTAMRALEAEGESVFALRLFSLLILTGARLREIMHAKRAWVDRKRSVLALSDHKTARKTGDKVIPLSPYALAAIDQTPVMVGNPYLIPGDKPKRPLINPYEAWHRVCVRAEVRDLTPHDWRRGFATIGLELGETYEQTGAVLGHSSTSTTKEYAIMRLDQQRRTAERIGARILALAAPAPQPSSETSAA